ncbi:sensor histidine kinase [Streptomyces sp. NBC_00690]|uniref:sensor histidine kinase n=1 Tax=Streptomyces sp. NBC_00690 TaxID=2975808 RepID=UPI00324E4444
MVVAVERVGSGSVTGADDARWVLDPASVLATTAATAAGLSVVSLWWAVPTAVAAFLAGRRPGRARPAVFALGAVLTAGMVAVSVVPEWLLLGSRFVAVVVAGMLSWFAGRFWRQYQELVRAGWERAEQLEREQRLVASQARLRERARIAQDMHDVLGHDLSLIALSAGALKLAPDLDERHRQAAGDIRVRAAAAVERLGEVIGVLREESDDAPTAASGSTIAQLAEEASRSGLVVELCLDREMDGLPPMVERAALRVVQEALTNVAKHAPGATATVRVTRTAAETTVVVENGPPSGTVSVEARPQGGGRGLLGLDERVRLVGGSFDHGPRDGGFTAIARLPHITPSQPPPLVATSGVNLPQEHRRARRRAGRALVNAAVLPLMTGALLTGGLVGWEMLTASQAVLEPGDFARLQVGQDRSEVGRLLPDRQITHRLRTVGPRGDGTRCEYYAMTADRFDSRSGDAYQLCFRENTLVSVDVVAP